MPETITTKQPKKNKIYRYIPSEQNNHRLFRPGSDRYGHRSLLHHPCFFFPTWCLVQGLLPMFDPPWTAQASPAEERDRLCSAQLRPRNVLSRRKLLSRRLKLPKLRRTKVGWADGELLDIDEQKKAVQRKSGWGHWWRWVGGELERICLVGGVGDKDGYS